MKDRAMFLVSIFAAIVIGLTISFLPISKDKQQTNENILFSLMDYEASFYQELKFLYASKNWKKIPKLLDNYKNSKSDVVGEIKFHQDGFLKNSIEEYNLSKIKSAGGQCLNGKEFYECSYDKEFYQEGFSFLEAALGISITHDAPFAKEKEVEITVNYKNGKIKVLSVLGVSYQNLNSKGYTTNFVYNFSELYDHESEYGEISDDLGIKEVKFKILNFTSDTFRWNATFNSYGDGEDVGGENVCPASLDCVKIIGQERNGFIITSDKEFLFDICVETSLRYHKWLNLNSLRKSKSINLTNLKIFSENDIREAKKRFEEITRGSPYVQDKNGIEESKNYEC